MRVLWFANTPSLYKKELEGYNGGGWIESLESSISNEKDLQLGICFFHQDTCFKEKRGNTTYYPISLYNSVISKVRRALFYSSAEQNELKAFLTVINDFKPDIIHVFGSEQSFGLLGERITIPLVLHVQGILNPYLNAWYPPGNNIFDYFKYSGLKKALRQLKTVSLFTHNANREKKILKDCKYILGRTNWDKDVTRIYSPNSQYFYCSEILRSVFYSATPWRSTDKKKIKIITTISQVGYKGYDLILKTASILKHNMFVDFEWIVFGLNNYNFWEKKLGIDHNNVCISLMGVASAETIIASMLTSDVFVHPSYIDNSPNSVCEAQMLGMPVISTDVGGLSSLITDEVSGLLVPANDPFTMACKIIELVNNRKFSEILGGNARDTALIRHDILDIVDQNLFVYNSVLKDKIC